ncbi:10757_t:CDS:1, partial [Dentiscutata erythropus]
GSVRTEINQNRLGSNPRELDLSDAVSSEECARILIEGISRGDKEILFTNRDKLIRLIEGVYPELLAYFAYAKAKKHVDLDRNKNQSRKKLSILGNLIK